MYYIERLSHLIDVSQVECTSVRVMSNSVVNIMGIKYMSGEGWGRYVLYMGTQKVRTFTKSKLMHVNGVTIDELLYHSTDVLTIRQENGEGTLQIELIGLELKPPAALVAFEIVE